MVKSKRLLSLTISQEEEETLIFLAERDGVSIGRKVNELLRMSLEYEEDKVLSDIADERLSEKNIKWVSSKDAWNL